MFISATRNASIDEDERSLAYKAVYSAGALDKTIEGISTDPGISSVF